MRNVAIALVLSLVLLAGVVLVIQFSRSGDPLDIDRGPDAVQEDARKAPAVRDGRDPAAGVAVKPRESVKIEVSVVTELGEPVPNARVRIERADEGRSSPAMAAAGVRFLTNRSGLGMPDGELEVGAYRVWADAEGFAPASDRVTLVKQGNAPFRVRLTLYSGVTISGRVFTKDRAPVGGARVTAYEEMSRKDAGEFDWLLGLLEMDRISKPLAVAETDAQGVYRLTGLGQGVDCSVAVTAGGFEPQQKNYVRAGTPNVDFYLDQGSLLTGRVQGRDGKGVSGATVEAYKKPGQTADLRGAVEGAMRGAIDAVQAAGDGTFVFGTLGQDEYVLVASAPGHRDGLQDVRLRRGGEAQVTITLEKGATLSGVVVGPSGSPVEGATLRVRLPPTRDSGAQARLNRETDKFAVTGANGTFLFDDLVDGACTVIVDHPRYAPVQEREINVPATHVEFALSEGGVIEGYVTDTDGVAVAGARVTVQDVATVQREGISDATGYYQIPALSVKPVRRKHVSCDRTGYARPEAQSISIEEGRTVEVNFVLERTSRVAGIVVDPDGKPVMGAKVYVQKLATPQSPIQRYLGLVHTGSDGVFDLPSVSPSDTAKLVVSHRYYETWESNEFVVGPGEDLTGVEVRLDVGGAISGMVVNDKGEPLAGARVAAVKAGESDTRSVQLGESSVTTDAQGNFRLTGLGQAEYEIIANATGYLQGRSERVTLGQRASTSGLNVVLVKARSVSGVVCDSGGQGIGGALITVVDESMGFRKLSAQADAQGQFEVGGLGEQPVEIQAEAPGYGRETLRGVAPGREDIAITLRTLGGVRGLVVDGDGQPVVAYSIKPDPIEVDPGFERPRTRFQTISQPDGVFEVGELPPGSYTINVQAPGYRGVISENIRVIADAFTEMGTLTLLPGGQLEGRVVDTVGIPVPGARVSVVGGTSRFVAARGTTPQVSVETDAQGRFRFDNLKGGATQFRVNKDGFVTTTSENVDPNTITGELVITMGRGASITGVVVDAQGKPIGKQQVAITGATSNMTTTNDNGRFAFEALPDGEYTVRTFSYTRQGEPAMLQVVLGPGESVDVELRRQD